MATNPYFGISDSEKQLFADLNKEAREQLKSLGWTDEQIDQKAKRSRAAKKSAAARKAKGKK
jgi:hypothetical protein